MPETELSSKQGFESESAALVDDSALSKPSSET